ncbi:hypothetical protein G6F31_018445 [Rhizopus arrhizus]|nr:hypothetical protein G6F31_018445 [Rhizopus arrhizus]
MALPCPTSSALIRQWPGSGRAGLQHSNGSMHTHPAYRAGQPRVCRAHTIPATASSSHGHGAAATAKLAQPALPTHATGTIV